MKTYKILFAVAFLTLANICLAQTQIANANVTISGLYTPAAPVIDGKLDDACWKNATLGQVTNSNAYNATEGKFPNRILQIGNYNDNGSKAGVTPPAAGVVPSGVSASFSTVWDTDYLYFIVKVIDGRLVGKAEFKGADVEIYFNNGNGRSAFNPGDANFPVKYSIDKDMQAVFGISKHSTTSPTTIGRVGGAGIALSASNSQAVYLGTSDGYILEGKISWDALNKEFVNAQTGVYSDATKKPFNNGLTRTLPFGFDIGINVPNDGFTDRGSQLMWNQCCWNTNWTQSQHFGLLSLTGVPKLFTPSGVNISAVPVGALVITSSGVDFPLKAVIDPDDAPQGVSWSVQGTNTAGFPLASINQFGILTPLNDGVVTVTASTFPRTITSFVNAIVPAVSAIATVTISGQKSVSGINISAATITANWGVSQPVSNILPSDAPSLVSWSMIQSLDLATMNTVTGQVTSLALGNGNVTIVGTSLANGIKGYFVLPIIQQDPVSCFILNAYDNLNQGSRTNTLVSFSGFDSSTGVLKTQIPLVFQYINKYEVTTPGIGSVAGYNISLIPNELIDLNVSFSTSGNGQVVFKSNTWFISFNKAVQGNITLTATYKNDVSKTSVTTGVVRAALPSTVPSDFCALKSGYDIRRLASEAVQPGCNPGYVLPVDVICASQLSITSTTASQFSVAPNPTSDVVSVSASVAISGLKVYSLTGVEVATSTTSSVSLAGASAGVYILEIATPSGSVYKKVIKE